MRDCNSILDLKIPTPAEGAIPNLVAYLPTRFLAALGLDSEMLRHIGENIHDPNHFFVKSAEALLEEMIVNQQPWLHHVLLLAPVALAVGLRVAFKARTTRGFARRKKVVWL
jgi:hypothetical protein